MILISISCRHLKRGLRLQIHKLQNIHTYRQVALSSKVRFLKRIFIDRMEGKGKVVMKGREAGDGSFDLICIFWSGNTLRIFERVLVGLDL